MNLDEIAKLRLNKKRGIAQETYPAIENEQDTSNSRLPGEDYVDSNQDGSDSYDVAGSVENFLKGEKDYGGVEYHGFGYSNAGLPVLSKPKEPGITAGSIREYLMDPEKYSSFDIGENELAGGLTEAEKLKLLDTFSRVHELDAEEARKHLGNQPASVSQMQQRGATQPEMPGLPDQTMQEIAMARLAQKSPNAGTYTGRPYYIEVTEDPKTKDGKRAVSIRQVYR